MKFASLSLRYFVLSVCAVIVATVSCALSADDGAGRALASAAAKKGLPAYSKALHGHEKEHGFLEGEKLESSEVSSVFPLYVISPERAGTLKSDSPLISALTFTGTYIGLVTVRAEPRAVLFVREKQPGDWKTGAFGMASFARRLHAISHRWGPEKVRIVTCPGRPEFFFSVLGEAHENLTPVLEITPSHDDGSLPTQWPPLQASSSRLAIILKELTESAEPTPPASK